MARRPLALHLGLAAPVAALFLSTPALATAPGGNDSSFVSYQPPPAVRRDGFAMGLSVGVGLLAADGYPNTVQALSDPTAEVRTGLVPGASLSLWLGGALRDWLTFGIGFRSSSGFSPDRLTSLPALLLHVEGFPLFFKGGHFKDLGLALDGGLGSGTIFGVIDQKALDPLASGGAMSFLGLTAFYEPLRFWHFSAGPGIGYMHAFSQSLTSHQVLLSFRLTFYGNQPKPAAAPPKSSVASEANETVHF
jgi:hypothetical protein